MVIISLELMRVNPDRNIFSINVDLLYRGLVHHHHRILNLFQAFKLAKEFYKLKDTDENWNPKIEKIFKYCHTTIRDMSYNFHPYIHLCFTYLIKYCSMRYILNNEKKNFAIIKLYLKY